MYVLNCEDQFLFSFFSPFRLLFLSLILLIDGSNSFNNECFSVCKKSYSLDSVYQGSVLINNYSLQLCRRVDCIRLDFDLCFGLINPCQSPMLSIES